MPTIVEPGQCGLCGTTKIIPNPGCHPVCRQCDRLKCGQCRNGDISGVARICPSCGVPMRGKAV